MTGSAILQSLNMEADHVTNQKELMANTVEDRDAKI